MEGILLLAMAMVGVTCNDFTYDFTWDFVDPGVNECCEKDDPKCIKYKGTQSSTSSGKKCQAWNQQSPHVHQQKKSSFDAGDFETNYCRNPDDKRGGAWCFTMDKYTRWEYCGIPTCQAGGGIGDDEDDEEETLDYSGEERLDLQEGDILESTRRNARQREQYLWPSGVVPILFNDSYPDSSKTFVLNALYQLEKEVNGDGHCIKVLPISKRESYLDHVRILDRDCCSSQIGAQQKRGQELLLGERCLQVPGTSQHEFMHTLGFRHEHSRIDRDDYVTIIKENIRKKVFDDMFKKVERETFGLPYDYDSIMHYPRFAFSIDLSKPTIVTKNNELIGNRNGPSENDIERIRRLYSCSSNGVVAKEKEIETEPGMKEIEFRGGVARAYSYWKYPVNPDEPMRAFSRQTSVTKPYKSAGRMPQAVWYTFPRNMTVARFGFRNRREYDHVSNNPVTFSFVGSKDCFKKYGRQTEFEKIVSVSNTTWPKNDYFQFWDVDKKDRRTYRCFGFEFYDSSSDHVAIQDVRMWEAQDILTDAEITPTKSKDSKDDILTDAEITPTKSKDSKDGTPKKKKPSEVGESPIRRSSTSTDTDTCKDEDKNCGYWRDLGKCKGENEIYMSKSCKKSCGTCAEAPTEAPTEVPTVAPTTVNPCEPNPCQNDGTCSGDGNCLCKDNYEGDICEFEMLTSEQKNPVQNGLMTEEPVQEMLTSEQKNPVQNDLARIRLVNREGLSNKSGRLEVLVNGQWGSICDDTGDNSRWSAEGHVDSRVSKVVCSMYGYTGVGIVVNEWDRRMTEMAKEEGEEFEKMREETGMAPLRWSKLHCQGDEISLFDCSFSDDMRKMWQEHGKFASFNDQFSPYEDRYGRDCKSHETIGIYCF